MFRFEKKETWDKSSWKTLWAAALINYHTWKNTKYDIICTVKVQHGNGRHFPSGTTRATHASRDGLLNNVIVGVFLEESVRTFTRTVVGVVFLRSDDPVPAKVFKVDGEWVATTAGLLRVLIARHSHVPWRSWLPLLTHMTFNKGILGERNKSKWLLLVKKSTLQPEPWHKIGTTSIPNSCPLTPDLQEWWHVGSYLDRLGQCTQWEGQYVLVMKVVCRPSIYLMHPLRQLGSNVIFHAANGLRVHVHGRPPS